MPIDRSGDPWSGATYNGFSGAPPAAPRARRAPRGRTMMIGGVAVALGLGVVFGLLARPQLVGSTADTRPSAAADLAPPGAAQVPIAVAPPPATEPPPRAPGKLQTLPPEMAAAMRAPLQPRPVRPAPAVESSAPPLIAPAPAPSAREPAPAASNRASFDCATARPGAEEMVCSDAGLAAADRQMARAWRRALGSGVDPGALRQEQRDWVAIREDAARHSRRALAEVYDQRIHELQEIAQGAPEE